MKNSPKFDPIAIAFPTDTLRVKDLIKLTPKRFEWDWPDTLFFTDPSYTFAPLIHAMLVERDFAAKAFNEALGTEQNAYRTPESIGLGDPVRKEKLLNELSEAYTRLGISTGMRQTCEITKEIVRQATSQAKGGRQNAR